MTRTRLWFAFFAGPAAWLVHLGVISALVPISCELDTLALVHVATVVTALVAVGGIVVSWGCWSAARHEPGYERFMGFGGLWLGALFLALILLEGAPALSLGPCR